eukprot:PITA_04924
MDVRSAFLNGDLKENVFMSQPEGFVVKGHEHKVCKLVKSLYGLKQASRAWYEKLTEHLLKLNFNHFDLDDATLFVKKVGKTIVYLVVYVDDLLMTGNNESYIASIKKELGKSFEITDLGYAHYYLGIEVTQHPKSIFLSQKKYIGDLLNRFGMTECNPLTTPMEQNLKLTSIEGKEFEEQQILVDSTTEAEYVAAAEATKEIVWLKKIIEDLQVKQVQSTPLMIDNTSAIKSAKNPKFHDRTKHINTKYHLIRHHVEAKTIHLRHCSTNEQIADIFNKALGREKLERFRMMLGLTNIPSD